MQSAMPPIVWWARRWRKESKAKGLTLHCGWAQLINCGLQKFDSLMLAFLKVNSTDFFCRCYMKKVILLSMQFGFQSRTSHYEASVLFIIPQLLQSICRFFYSFKKHLLGFFSMPGSDLNRKQVSYQIWHSSKEREPTNHWRSASARTGAVLREEEGRAWWPPVVGVGHSQVTSMEKINLTGGQRKAKEAQ